MKNNNDIFLGPIQKSNLSKYLEWRNNPIISDWCRQTDYLTEENQSNWYEKINTDPSIRMYEILKYENSGETGVFSKTVGVCGFTSINQIHGSAEFSIYIAPEYQRKGYAEKALKKLISHGFNDKNLNRIWGESFEGNPAVTLYSRLGFKKEGDLRESYFKNGKYINSSIWSILKSEFILSPYIDK